MHRFFIRPVLAAAVAVCGGTLAAANDDVRPDVLFIAVDDLNDWIGCLTDPAGGPHAPLGGGHPDTATPNLDRLAARGTLFTNAHCAAPACNPSRAAVMSGRRPTTTGIYLNGQPYAPPLRGVATLPDHFRGAGYDVAGGGKLFHGGQPEEARRWGDYFPLPAFPKPPAAENGTANGLNKRHFDWAPVDEPDAAMGDTKLADWAIERLGRDDQPDAPRLLGVGFYRPHLPWFAPRPYFEATPDRPGAADGPRRRPRRRAAARREDGEPPRGTTPPS